jgi:CRP-like cAMP-binding protein
MENVELLKKVRIFQGLSDDEVKKFADIVTLESFPAESIIIEEGAEGKALYLIKRGTVSVTKIDGEMESEIVKLVVGEEFGEMSLIEDATTSARVSAYNDLECLVISRQPFLEILDNDLRIAATVYKNFTRILSQRLRHTSSELVTWKPDIEI